MTIEIINKLFQQEISSIKTECNSFGFRERVKIERCLYLLLKHLVNHTSKINIQGFNKETILKIKESSRDNEVRMIVDQIFEFKVFIKSLSSNNAYTLGDTLSKVNINPSEIKKFLTQKSENISQKIANKCRTPRRPPAVNRRTSLLR